MKKVLGIDPGFTATGFAIVSKEGNRAFLIEVGYLSLPVSQSLPARITLFHDTIKEKIIQHQITDLAIETPFLGKNPQNFLKLGYLRGMLYFLSHQHALALHEFSPTQVKQSLTGFGGASKEQVARVLAQLFPRMPEQKKADATDALAISLCGLWKQTSILSLMR